jgi:recombination protein RecA
MGGRAAQIKAALNAAWLDELIPLLGQTDCTMLCIARQTLDEDGQVKIGGGGALVYDSSMVVEVERDGFVTDGAEKDAAVYGERHAVVVRKSKLAGREEKWPTAYYHSSNGRLVPAGFDRPRDLLDMAIEHGVADKGGGGWISLDGEKLGQGMNRVVQRLHAEPDLLARLEAAVLERQPPAPAEVVESPADA